MSDSRKVSVLVVEDDPALVELLRYNLESENFAVIVAEDGEEGLAALDENDPDIVVLDWMLPKVSGVEFCRHVRKQGKDRALPIIMLTARGEEADKVLGLDSGADDYMVKPFSPGELISRIKAILRRSRPERIADELSYGGITIDLVQHRVFRDGEALHLGPTEFRLLRVLMERPGRVFSREQLLDLAWGRDIYLERRTVDVHIRRLRKILNTGGMPDLIRTVRATGYALDEKPENWVSSLGWSPRSPKKTNP
jgi:two-component system, OmpR family, phosphate regulon response regulator PhoB